MSTSQPAFGFRNPFDWLYNAAVSRLRFWRYLLKYRIQRLRRAWGYLTDRLSADDAQSIMLDVRCAAGWYPLLSLTLEDTLEQARETFADTADLRRLIANGCARVGDKWESYNDDLYEARRWAINTAKDYADQEGITLARLDEGDSMTTVN